MNVPLDPVGNISLILQITILFLLVLGLPLVRSGNSKKNLLRHGYLTVLALALHTVLILIVMIPTFDNGVGELGSLSFFNFLTVWSHAVLGSTAEVVAAIIVGFWLAKSPSKMVCVKMRKVMWPLMIIWIISVVNGALIHILGML